MDNDSLIYLGKCPNCGVEGPSTKYCLSCGASKLTKSDESPNDPLEDLEISMDNIEISNIPTFDESEYHTRKETESFTLGEPGYLMKNDVTEMKNSINLIHWITDLYLKGEVEDDDFNDLFGDYEYRFEQCLTRRNKVLELTKNIKPMEKAYKETKLRISELELKKKLGDITEEEYNLKMPVYQWDIDKYKKEMRKNNVNISLFESISKAMSKNEIKDVRKTTEKRIKDLDKQMKEESMDKRIGNRIKKILEKIDSIFNNGE